MNKKNKKVASKNISFRETRVFIDQETGEIIEGEVISRKVISNDSFEIIYKNLLRRLMREHGSIVLKVFAYLMEYRTITENLIATSVEQIATDLQFSYQSIITALKILEKGNHIVRNYGIIVISPDTVCNAKYRKRIEKRVDSVKKLKEIKFQKEWNLIESKTNKNGNNINSSPKKTR